MGHDPFVDDTGVGLDLCEKEQSALARRYVLTQTLDTSEPWSHAGPRSISPFAPCASSRVQLKQHSCTVDAGVLARAFTPL